MERVDPMGMRNTIRRPAKGDSLRQLACSREYGFIDAFCGPGGIGIGLKNAGFKPLLSFDFNAMAVATHKHNLPGECLVADARELNGPQLSRRIGRRKRELDLFAGGPPCQGFSKQKRGAHLGDERNDLISEYLRLVQELKPRFFLLENVAIFGQKRGRKYLQDMATSLHDYRVYPAFYNSADYGLAQTRERFVVVGKREDQRCNFHVPPPTATDWLTVGEVLSRFPEPPEDYSVHPDFPNHQRARVTEINIKRFSFVPQGGGWQDIPNKYRLECHKNADPSSGGWPDVYGRLEWGGQCPTITGGFDSYTRGRYGHPLQDRPITPREAAALQGFPDDFIFYGTRADTRSQIGNAVPPPLAEAIGTAILRSLLCADGIIEDDQPEAPVQTVLFQ